MPVSITRWTPLRGNVDDACHGVRTAQRTGDDVRAMRNYIADPRALQDLIEDVDREFADDFESAEIRHRGAPLLRWLQQNLASAVDEKDGERAMHQSKLMLAQLLIRANLGIAFVD
jgi:hypothetical protein